MAIALLKNVSIFIDITGSINSITNNGKQCFCCGMNCAIFFARGKEFFFQAMLGNHQTVFSCFANHS